MATHGKPVLGVTAAAPRPTPAALRLALLYLGLPFVTALLVLDIAIWAVATAIWDVCIGVWCWF